MMSKKSPQLRFEGFTDDWVQRKLGDLVDSYNKIVSGKSNYPVATSSRRGLFLQSDYFDGSRSGIDENVDFHKVPEKYITYRHMSDDSIFKFNQNDFDTPVLVSKEYPVFRSNQQANQTFLLDHLNNSPEFLKFSTLQKLGGTRVRLYFKNLQAYKLMMPNIEEQNAIASFFTTVDNLIAANQRKLDLLKEQKKGFLQKMFPKNGAKVPELRFAGFADDWEERKLGDYIIQYSEKTKQNNQYPVFTSSRNGLFFQKDYYKGNQIASEDNTGYNIVPRGYFTYRHMSDDLVFKFNINDLADYGIVSTLYPVFTTNEQLDSKYLQYQLNEGSEFRRFSLLQKQGGSRTYMYLNKLQNMILTIPKLEEQQKIGSFFKQLDETIDLHQRKVDLLKEQKKGFLQKMFV
ncbi:restriction endonuclease subunit S [Lactococcus lactis]|uniref:restriction endonuclease subunit S n=1 Tax=Lactococcus lactis TaxID=1358 RepID=UPI002072EB5C|nr:restriction endonuclease subunit S [Lactococcus lactis]MCM6842038.1 restriction endonuclease subunit S [Lactococcus lactis]MCM6847703.1 restriction endonuclease subunit S [Lactococcus lactis]MCM6852271.1 restriction endonuclease subunit S [Lactococcus lactis]MCM6857820.1 restriction endonuclease subunit S [Lactococcus lactis]MDM7657393.1 restriction endonuclease subunit S [Lactococcus lactis]